MHWPGLHTPGFSKHSSRSEGREKQRTMNTNYNAHSAVDDWITKWSGCNITVVQRSSSDPHCSLTYTLSSGSETIPRFTLTPVASWHVQTGSVVLTHRSILTLIDICPGRWETRSETVSTNANNLYDEQSHVDVVTFTSHLHKSTACRCRWTRWDTRT